MFPQELERFERIQCALLREFDLIRPELVERVLHREPGILDQTVDLRLITKFDLPLEEIVEELNMSFTFCDLRAISHA